MDIIMVISINTWQEIDIYKVILFLLKIYMYIYIYKILYVSDHHL